MFRIVPLTTTFSGPETLYSPRDYDLLTTKGQRPLTNFHIAAGKK